MCLRNLIFDFCGLSHPCSPWLLYTLVSATLEGYNYYITCYLGNITLGECYLGNILRCCLGNRLYIFRVYLGAVVIKKFE